MAAALALEMPAQPTVRYARDEDVPLIRALMQRSQCYVDQSPRPPTSRASHLLVLDDGSGQIIAAASFTITRHGHLDMLVVDPDRDEAHALEQRMLAVVEAMCDAHGATTLDVPARRAA